MKGSVSLEEIRLKSVEDLRVLAEKMRKEFSDAMVAAFKDRERSPERLRVMRKDIARILTVIREKEIAAARTAAASTTT